MLQVQKRTQCAKCGYEVSTMYVCTKCGTLNPSHVQSKIAQEKVDFVNSPSHYIQGKIECIDFIEDQKFDYCLGNAIKYIVRSRHKGNESQDLEKAIWYLQRKLRKLNQT